VFHPSGLHPIKRASLETHLGKSPFAPYEFAIRVRAVCVIEIVRLVSGRLPPKIEPLRLCVCKGNSLTLSVTTAEIFQTRFEGLACLVCEKIAFQTRWKAFSCLKFWPHHTYCEFCVCSPACTGEIDTRTTINTLRISPLGIQWG